MSYERTIASAGQLALFEAACGDAPIGPWNASKTPGLGYFYDNHFFRFGDANALWHKAKTFRAKRLI